MKKIKPGDEITVTVTISYDNFRVMVEHLSRQDRNPSSALGYPLIGVHHLLAVNGDPNYNLHMFEYDVTNIDRYDIVARAQLSGALHTEILILNNNADTYLVVTRLDADANEGMKVGKFHYGSGENEDKNAFRDAMDRMRSYITERWE